jgi:hypothetical protein
MSKKNKDQKQDQKQEPNDFIFPTELVEQVYEISGAADSYKGVILCVCSSKGTPQVYTRFDSTITALGMKAAVWQWLAEEENKLTATDND